MRYSCGLRRRMAAAMAVPAAALAAMTAVTALPAVASAATGRHVPVNRRYPVLVDGVNSGGHGKLTEIGPSWKVTLKLASPGEIAVDRNGRHAYVADGTKVAVIGRVNTAHPKITAMVAAGNSSTYCTGVAVTPNGGYLYVTLIHGARSVHPHGRIKVYKGAATGKLRLVATLNAGWSASSPVVTPNGRYAYVADPFYHAYTEIGGAQTRHPKVIRHTSGPHGIMGILVGLSVTPNGRFLYAGAGTASFGELYVFKHAESAHAAGDKAFGLPGIASAPMLTPNGRWGYASYYPGRVLVIKNAETNPRKARTLRLPGAANPQAIQPSGRYAYATAGKYGHGGKILVLSGALGGHLKVAATWRLPYTPQSIAVSPVR